MSLGVACKLAKMATLVAGFVRLWPLASKGLKLASSPRFRSMNWGLAHEVSRAARASDRCREWCSELKQKPSGLMRASTHSSNIFELPDLQEMNLSLLQLMHEPAAYDHPSNELVQFSGLLLRKLIHSTGIGICMC